MKIRGYFRLYFIMVEAGNLIEKITHTHTHIYIYISNVIL